MANAIDVLDAEVHVMRRELRAKSTHNVHCNTGCSSAFLALTLHVCQSTDSCPGHGKPAEMAVRSLNQRIATHTQSLD